MSNFDLIECGWKIWSDYKTYKVNDNWYDFNLVTGFIVIQQKLDDICSHSSEEFDF